MSFKPLVICGLIACSNDSPEAPDAAIPIDARKRCASFGAFQPMGTITRTGGLPVSPSGVESDPWIVRDGDALRMWFTTASRTPPHDVRIASAVSTDGRVWRDVNDSVLPPTAATFDGEGVETASVVRHAGEYKLFYTADEPPDGATRFAIGLARSPDGVTWTKHGPVVAPQLPWELHFCENDECAKKIGGTLEPSVLVEGDRLRMWYAALGVVGETPSYRIGHATSSDGVTWTRTPDPVFTVGPAGSWDEVLVSHTNVVADPGGSGYHLFYFGSSIADYQACEAAAGCLLTPGSIGHAFSTDGITWTRNPKNPVLRATSSFDAWSVGGPMVLIEDGVVRLWYFGTPSAHSLDLRMAYATAPCD
jgi:predicted GH43/DUF377 family glycosyl hydrolase